MTTRRKLSVAAALLVVVGVIVVLLMVRTSGPPIVATLVRYQPGDSNAIVRIANRSRCTWSCWAVGTTNRKIGFGTAANVIGPRESLQFPVHIERGPPFIRVYCECESTKERIKHYVSEVSDIYFERTRFSTNLALPE